MTDRSSLLTRSHFKVTKLSCKTHCPQILAKVRYRECESMRSELGKQIRAKRIQLWPVIPEQVHGSVGRGETKSLITGTRLKQEPHSRHPPPKFGDGNLLSVKRIEVVLFHYSVLEHRSRDVTPEQHRCYHHHHRHDQAHSNHRTGEQETSLFIDV